MSQLEIKDLLSQELALSYDSEKISDVLLDAKLKNINGGAGGGVIPSTTEPIVCFVPEDM
jgi:hypothetical protein